MKIKPGSTRLAFPADKNRTMHSLKLCFRSCCLYFLTHLVVVIVEMWETRASSASSKRMCEEWETASSFSTLCMAAPFP